MDHSEVRLRRNRAYNTRRMLGDREAFFFLYLFLLIRAVLNQRGSGLSEHVLRLSVSFTFFFQVAKQLYFGFTHTTHEPRYACIRLFFVEQSSAERTLLPFPSPSKHNGIDSLFHIMAVDAYSAVKYAIYHQSLPCRGTAHSLYLPRNAYNSHLVQSKLLSRPLQSELSSRHQISASEMQK